MADGLSLLPEHDWPVMQPFWQAANRGELVFPRCKRCGTWHGYPTYMCRECEGELEWVSVAPHGTLYSWVVVRRALVAEYREKVPYIVALLEIDDAPGVRFVLNTTDMSCEKKLYIGAKMQIVFERLSDAINMPRCLLAEQV